MDESSLLPVLAIALVLTGAQRFLGRAAFLVLLALAIPLLLLRYPVEYAALGLCIPSAVFAWSLLPRSLPEDGNPLEVYVAKDDGEAHLLRHRLEEAGIRARIVGDLLLPLAGEIPFGAASSPRIWISPEDRDRALAIVREFDSERRRAVRAPPPAPWTCPACGEEVPGELALCWNCRKEPRDAPETREPAAPEPPAKPEPEGREPEPEARRFWGRSTLVGYWLICCPLFLSSIWGLTQIQYILWKEGPWTVLANPILMFVVAFPLGLFAFSGGILLRVTREHYRSRPGRRGIPAGFGILLGLAGLGVSAAAWIDAATPRPPEVLMIVGGPDIDDIEKLLERMHKGEKGERPPAEPPEKGAPPPRTPAP